MNVIKIENKEYPIKFNLRTFYLFGEKYQLDGINDIVEKISGLLETMTNIKQKDFEVLGNLIHAAITQGCKSENIPFEMNSEQLTDCLFDDFSILNSAVDIMTKSMGTFMGEQNPEVQKETPVIEQTGAI